MGSPVLNPSGYDVETDEQSSVSHDRFGADRPVRAHWRDITPRPPVVSLTVGDAPAGSEADPAGADYTPKHVHSAKKTLRLSVSALAESMAKTYLILLVALALWSLVPTVWGWDSRVVMTGSMEPAINPGDVVVSAPFEWDRLLPGNVVVVNDPNRPGQTLTHRYVRANDDGQLITKGDNNAAEDSTPTPIADAVGTVRLRIPMVGLPKIWIASGDYAPVAAMAAITFLSLMVVWGGENRKSNLRDRIGPPSGPKRLRHTARWTRQSRTRTGQGRHFAVKSTDSSEETPRH